MDFKEYTKQNLVLFDGAMGTYFNQLHPEKMEAEEANIAHASWIIQIHKRYLQAGAQVLRTNTFAVNHYLFPNPDELRAQIKSAIQNARIAQEEFEQEQKGQQQSIFIAASLGPIKQSIDMTREDVLDEYRMLVNAFLEENISIFVLETFAELSLVKEVAKQIRQQKKEVYIIGNFSVNPMGYTKYGYSIQRIINELAADPVVDTFGFNCGLGAAHISKLLTKVCFSRKCSLSILPNAGYQHELRGRLRYHDNPAYYAKHMQKVVSMGADMIGGCCGTTPEHIRALAQMLQRLQKEEQVTLPCEKTISTSTVSANTDKEPNIFMEKLMRGQDKVFVVELDSPFGADADRFRSGAFALKENGVDMITISDSPMARARADAFEMAVYVRDKVGMEVMPHVACRDRNLIGLRSSILGAHINEIRNMLIITGDPVSRDDRNSITGVFDVNSIRLMEYVRNMNEELFGRTPVYYGGALNYAGVNVEAIIRRMNLKIAAGCSYFLTQPVYSKEDIARIRYLKERVDTKILCGLMPLVSYKNALFMHNEMPGIHVPDEVLAQYRPDMTRKEAEQVAIAVAVDTAKELYDVVDGFYLMTPFHRVELVNEIICAIRECC